MRKITLFFAALVYSLSMLAASETVYFVNANSWTGTIKAHLWGGTAASTSWNGNTMTKEAEQMAGFDVYSYTAEAGHYANVIFNNGSAQTADLTWTAGKYYVKDGWYTKDEALAKLDQPIEYETVYFVDAYKWGSVNIYTWTPEVKTWPGQAMTKEAEQIAGYDVYSYTVEKGTSFGGMNFNCNDDSKKTGDLQWTAGKYYVKNAWFTKEEATQGLKPSVKLAGVVTWDGTDMTLSDDYKTATLTLNLQPGNYELKIIEEGAWLGHKGTMVRDNSSDWDFATNVQDNCKLTADIAGDYTFTWTFETNKLSVAYPALPEPPATVTKQFTYSHTFAKNELGTEGSPLATATLSDVAWNFAMTGSTYLGWDSNNGKGIQMGKSAGPATSIVLSTSGIEGKITKIVVNTSGASDIKGTFAVSVNGVAYAPVSIDLTKTATEYEFTGAETGEIKFSWAQTSSKAIYIKSIKVEYEKEVAADFVETPVFSVESGVKEEAFNLELTCATANAEIYYTLNGGAETKYTGAINIAATTTVKAWAVKGETRSEEVSATYTFVEYVENATIAQVLAAEVSQYVWYKLTGTIDSLYNTEYGNFNLVNGDDKILVYGLTATKVASNDKSFASLNLVEGDKITIWGTRGAFNGKAQVSGPAYFVEKVEESQPQVINAVWSIDGVTLEDGAVIEKFPGITVTFSGVDHLGRKVDGAEVTKVYPLISTVETFFAVAEDGTTTPVVSEEMEGYNGVLRSSAAGCVVTLSLAERYKVDESGAYIKPGNYRIVLPGAKVQLQPKVDNQNVYAEQDFTFNFTIENDIYVEGPAPVEANYTVNPADSSNVKNVNRVELTFTDATAITLGELGESPNPTVWPFVNRLLVSEEYTMVESVAPMVSAVEGNKLILTIYSGYETSTTTPGTYTVTIPAGVVYFDSVSFNKAITLTYVVPEPVITPLEAKNAYAYDVTVETDEEITKATVSYRLNAPAVAVKVLATVNDEVVREVVGTNVCRYVDGALENLNTVEVSLADLIGEVVFKVEVEGTIVETPTEVAKHHRFYHPKGVEVDANPESEFFGRVYATEGMLVAKDGKTYISDTNGNGVGQGLYAFDATLAPIANKDGKYGFNGGLTFTSKNPADKYDYSPLRVVLSEDGRLFFSRQSVGVSPLVEVNPADLDANFTEVFTGFVCDSTTYDLNTVDGAFMAAPNVGFDVKGTGEDLKVLMLSTKVGGWDAAKSAFRVDEYNLGTATTWSAAPSTAVEALSGKYIVTYTSSNVEYDNEGGMWLIQHRGTPSASEPALVHLNAEGVVDYVNTTINAAASGFAFNADYTLLAFAGNGNQKCTIYAVGKDENGAPTLTEKYNFGTTIGTNLNDIAWDYADNLYLVGNSGEYLKVFALPRENAVVTTPAAKRYTVDLTLPDTVRFANIAAIYEKGIWEESRYATYEFPIVILESQPTVVDVVVTPGFFGATNNNYYLNDGTGVIVMQAEGDRYETIWDEETDEQIGVDTIHGLTLEVGKKLPAEFFATINFNAVMDDETYLPTGEVYGAPVLTFMPKVLGVEVDEYGWEEPITEPNADFVARCEESDFVETAVEADLADVLANRIQYAGQLLKVDTTANYYAEAMMDHMSGAEKTTAYFYWDAETAFDVETYENGETTLVVVSPKVTEDYNNYSGQVFNVFGEELPVAAFDAEVTMKVANVRFDWNSIAQGQTLILKEGWEVLGGSTPVDVENSELVVNIYSNNGAVYVETEAGAMIEVYTVNGLRVYAGVSNTNTTIINGLNTNVAIIRVNGEAYKVFVK